MNINWTGWLAKWLTLLKIKSREKSKLKIEKPQTTLSTSPTYDVNHSASSATVLLNTKYTLVDI